jgi:hypothetical protein
MEVECNSMPYIPILFGVMTLNILEMQIEVSLGYSR